MKKFLAYAFPVIIVMLIIFFISSMSYIPGPFQKGILGDVKANGYHFIIFLLLAFLTRRCFKAYNFKKFTVYVLLFVLFYSISDEVHQLFVPHRAFDVSDLVSDNLGSLLLISKDFIKQKLKI